MCGVHSIQEGRLAQGRGDRKPWQTLELFEDGNPTKSEQVLLGGWFSPQHLQSSMLNLTKWWR